MILFTSRQKYLIVLLFVITLAIIDVRWANILFSPKVSIEGQKATAFTPSVKIWADTLAENENCPPEGKIDTNGKLSYGRYCFQEATWLRYASSSQIAPSAEPNELMNFIGSDEDQDRVLAWMIENDRKSLKGHWWTSIVKRGVSLPPAS